MKNRKMAKETNNRAQYCIAFAVALASMSASAAFSWTTPVIPKFHSNETSINVTDTEISWLVVSVTPGLMLGSLTSQVLSDNAGRRPTIIASAIPLCTGTVFILLANKVWMFYVARFLWGIGVGMIQTVTTMYLTEIASKDIRGVLAIGNRFMFNFGGFLVIAIGSFVTYQVLSYMLIVLPVAYVVVCWWVPESPYYLLKEAKVEPAKMVLMRLNGCKEEKMIETKFTEMRKHVQEDMKRSATVKELFTGKRYRKALIIAFGLRTFQLMSGSIALQQYVGRIMQDTESSMTLSTGLIIFAALRLFISMLASGIVDRVGRRPLLIYSFSGSSITLAIIGTCSFINEVLVHNNTILFGNIVILGIVCLTILSTIGYDTVVHLVAPEIFPLNVKSIAMTCTNLYVAVVTFVAIRGYQIVKDLTGLFGVFWFFGAGCFAGAIFSYVVLPETKGKSLREIQMELQGPLYEQEIKKVETETEDAEAVLMEDIK